ncbi:hypothetical protein RB594_002052 [Gaeumannomyces avenae]
MASLKFIMEPEVDLPSHETIRAPASFATPLTSRAPESSAHQDHSSTSGQDHSNYYNTIDSYRININKETNTGHPPPPLTAAATTTAAPDAHASAAASSLLSRKRHPGLLEGAPRSPGATSSSSRHANPRRRSTTSPDSMDGHSYPPPTPMGASGRGAGVGEAPAGRGGIPRRGCIVGGMGQLDHPTRPMPPHPPTESPVRLTPITGRISRAKKGQPVHICTVCRPSKTFTRAEHLRRHQLSHRTPGFACEWPGCDRAFHRHDLLVRHQQKHEQEGDGASSGPRRGSSGMVTLTPTSTCEVPSTPNMPTPANHSSRDAAISRASPRHIGRDYGDRSSLSRQRPDPYNNGEFILSNPGSNPVPSSASTPTTLNHTGYVSHQPRVPINLNVVTQGLRDPSIHSQDGPIPDLTSTTDVSISSPWASSTDSTYSTTPSEARGHPQAAWIPSSGSPHREWLPTYHTANDPLTVPYPFPSSPHPLVSPHPGYSVHPVSHNNHYTIMDVMGGAFSAPEDLSQRLHHQAMGVDSGPSAGVSHDGVVPRNSISLSSVGSSSPITAPTRHPGPLATPSTSLPSDNISMIHGLGRSKEVMMADPSGMGMVVSMGGGSVSMLGSAPYDLSGGGNSPGGGGFLPSQGLGGMGSCVSGPILIPSPLSKAVHNMIPTYLDAYWNHHSTAYPLAHRHMSNESGEDVLRCAMAAVGSQLLDSKEDRNKGIILHDHVVQELKLIAQWNLPIMQAIILCEYFSRFRGKKSVMRPSKRFESLYSRVSSSFLDQTSDDSSLYPGSSGVPSSMSSSYTSTSSRSSWYSESASTPTALSGFQSFGYDHTPFILPSSSSSSFSAQHPLALPSTFGGPASAAVAMKHQYLDQSQAMNRLSSIFEHASTAHTSPHLTTDQRWRAWLDAEAHRRLLNACFSLDIHTSIYHEHHRSRDFDILEHGRVPPIPLIGRSRDLWNAQSAEEWDAILNRDPDAGVPLFIPHPDQLTPMIPEEGSASGCHGVPLNTFDRLAILDFEASRLPRRMVAGSSPSSSDGGSPTPIADESRRAGGDWSVLGDSSTGSIGLDPVDAANPDLASLDVEARISYLFPGCPVASTYLALHHTPLHDLLAVSGDSSMLLQKSPTNKPTVNNRKRFRLWVEQGQVSPASLGLNKSVVKATTYAARALLEFLGPEACLDATGGGFGAMMCKLSDYWAVYVCALICWSSGHQPGRGGEQIGSDVAVSDGEALEWLRSAAHAQPDDANAWAHIWASRGAIGVVSLARRRLEVDLSGARSRLHSDAVARLKELEQGVNWRGF